MPYQANEVRRHKFSKARYQVKNWRAYDHALQERGSLTVWVTPEALATWHAPPTAKRGRSSHYSNVAIETGHLLRLAFQQESVNFQGQPTSCLRRLRTEMLVETPDTTAERCLPTPY